MPKMNPLTPEEMTARVLNAIELDLVVVVAVEPASKGEAIIRVRLHPTIEKQIMDDTFNYTDALTDMLGNGFGEI